MPSAKYINLCEESAFRAFMGELYTKNNLRLLPEIILGSGNIQNLPDRPLRQFLMNIFSPTCLLDCAGSRRGLLSHPRSSRCQELIRWKIYLSLICIDEWWLVLHDIIASRIVFIDVSRACASYYTPTIFERGTIHRLISNPPKYFAALTPPRRRCRFDWTSS